MKFKNISKIVFAAVLSIITAFVVIGLSIRDNYCIELKQEVRAEHERSSMLSESFLQLAPEGLDTLDQKYGIDHFTVAAAAFEVEALYRSTQNDTGCRVIKKGLNTYREQYEKMLDRLEMYIPERKKTISFNKKSI